jgi:hypothetical protein
LLSVVRFKASQAEASIINETLHSRSKKEKKMKTTSKTAEMKDRKVILTILWIFVMFNFTYADILTLYFNGVLQKEAMGELLSGHVGPVQITQGFVLLAACRRERSRDVASYKASAHVIEGTRREERAERDHRQNSVGDDARSRVGSMPSLAG